MFHRAGSRQAPGARFVMICPVQGAPRPIPHPARAARRKSTLFRNVAYLPILTRDHGTARAGGAGIAAGGAGGPQASCVPGAAVPPDADIRDKRVQSGQLASAGRAAARPELIIGDHMVHQTHPEARILPRNGHLIETGAT